MKTVIYIFLLCILIFQINKVNPLWLDFTQNMIVDGQKLYPGVAPPFNVSKHPGLEEASFTYRGDVQRRGLTQEILKTPLTLEKSIADMNYGIHGASKSSVSVDQWGIVIPTDSSWIYHYDHDYKMTWKFFVSESDRGIHGTAVLTEKVVYFGAYNGRMYALNRKTGQPIWVTKLGGALGASPVLWKKHIYIAVERTDITDGYLVKLNALNGELIWKSIDIGEQAHSSPAIDPDLGIIYFGANNEKFFAFSDIDGSLKWEYKANGPIKGTPAVGRTCVLFTDWSGRMYCLRGATGHLKWSQKIESKSQSSPTLIEEINKVIILSNNGNVFAYNYDSGELAWHKKFKNTVMMGSGTAYKKNGQWKVALPCDSKKACILNVNDGQVLDSVDLDSVLTSVPTIYNQKLYISTNDNGIKIFKSAD